MKIPRDESAASLIHRVSKLGYIQTRQTGSHIRLSRISIDKREHITIPNHNPIKIGTLAEIIRQIALQLEMDKAEVIKLLFERDI